MDLPKLLYIVFFIFLFESCKGKRTPLKFANKAIVGNTQYRTHINVLTDSMKMYVVTHKNHIYDSGAFGPTSIVYIDTILYSPDYDRLAFFTIVRHQRDFHSDTNARFDAKCFIANVEHNQIEKISWLSDYGLINYKTFKSTSERIRQLHFTEFYREGSDRYIYNLDDVRFWSNTAIWNEK